MSNHPVPATAGGMPAPTRRAVLIGGAATAALAGATVDALAAIPSWMALKIEAHREAVRGHHHATEIFSIHDAALIHSPRRSEDLEWKAAGDAQRQAAEREDRTFRALLAEHPRTMADHELRACYLLAEARDDLDGHPDFILLLVASMTGREG